MDSEVLNTIGSHLEEGKLEDATDIIQQNPSFCLSKFGTNEQTPLHYACQLNDLDSATVLFNLDSSIFLTSRTKDGKTPIDIVIEKGCLPILHLFHGHPSSEFYSAGKSGKSLLHLAAQHGQGDIVKFLCEEKKYSSSLADRYGRTPLYLACSRGHLDTVQYLLQYADPKKGQTTQVYTRRWSLSRRRSSVISVAAGRTCLHEASSEGHVKIVECLCSNGFSPDSKDHENVTPLYLAAQNGRLEVIRYLVEHASGNPTDEDIYGLTALHVASACGHFDVVEYLAPMFDYVPVTTKKTKLPAGQTPLHLAAFEGHKEVAEYLILSRKHPVKLDTSQCTPLHYAVMKGNIDVAKYLVEHCQVEMNGDIKGKTPLHFAAAYNNVEIVQWLVDERKCNPACVTLSEKTPLHLAAENNCTSVIDFLMHKGKVDLTAIDDSGETPLHKACKKGHMDAVQMLCRISLNPYAYLDSSIPSPLHLATINGHLDIVKFLVSNEIFNPFKMCDKPCLGSNCLDLAKEFDKRAIFDYLKRLESLKVKVYVIGNSQVGKSTLIEVLQLKSSFKKAMQFIQPVTVESHTGGIALTEFQSQHFGTVLFHEFGGEPLYYASHELVLGSGQEVVFVVIVSLIDNEEGVKKNLQYWLSYIHSVTRLLSEIRVIVIGSHVDRLNHDDVTNKRRILSDVGRNMPPSLKCIGIATLDCRHAMLHDTLKTHLNTGCTSVRMTTEQGHHELCGKVLAHMQHLDQSFLTKMELEKSVRNCSDLWSEITELKNDSQMQNCKSPEDVLLCLCKELQATGHITVLQSCKGCWIVMNESIVMTKVHKCFKQISAENNNTYGIVSQSELREFSRKMDLDFEFLVGYLQKMELCVHITDKVSLNLMCVPPKQSEEYFFFPSLVESEYPSDAWRYLSDSDDFNIGWCLTWDNGFITPRLLQTLQLRLSCIFAMIDERSTRPFMKSCWWWKDGVRWLDSNGCAVCVRVIENFSKIVLLMRHKRDLQCIRVRSQVLKEIRKIVHHCCPQLQFNEYILHPDFLKQFQFDRKLNLDLHFKLERVINSIRKRLRSVTLECSPGESHGINEHIDLSNLLFFESYYGFRPDSKVTAAFLDSSLVHQPVCNYEWILHEFAQDMCHKWKEIATILDLEMDIQQQGDATTAVQKCMRVLIHWCEASMTFEQLQQILHEYSIL